MIFDCQDLQFQLFSKRCENLEIINYKVQWTSFLKKNVEKLLKSNQCQLKETHVIVIQIKMYRVNEIKFLNILSKNAK